MRFTSILVLFIAITLATVAAEAAKYRRLVNFEWDAVEGATSYEIELIPVRDIKSMEDEPKIFKFKVPKSSWNGRLTPGKYLMRLRSRDYRGVPGEWSPQSDFHVGLDQVVLKAPLTETLATNEKVKKQIEFTWDEVGGASEYQFTLSSADGKTTLNQKLTETKFKVELPVASRYQWRVSAINPDGIVSEGDSSASFTLLGAKLQKAQLEKPESEFLRQLKWTAPEYAQSYDVMLIRRNEKTKKYEKFRTIEKTTVDTLDFESSWPGGLYKVAVRSHGDKRPASDLATMAFKVRGGDRSPAAEYTALVKKSIDRVTGWYAIASYLITEVKFSGVNPERNSVASYNAIGGTGRLGLGWFGANTPWGFLGILDLSGLTVKSKTTTYASAEMNAVYRISLGDRSEVRLQGGPFFREHPESIGIAGTDDFESLKIVSAGPHFGGELWYSLSPKLGVQLNAHLYMPMVKIETPNGQNLESTVSMQLGLLGSYRLTPNFTGLIGWAMREDRMKYDSMPGTTPLPGFATTNESTIQGNYLNIFAEWAF